MGSGVSTNRSCHNGAVLTRQKSQNSTVELGCERHGSSLSLQPEIQKSSLSLQTEREKSFLSEKSTTYQPSYARFPTHISLRDENLKWLKTVGKDFFEALSGFEEHNHRIKVFPATSLKEDFYGQESFVLIDRHALQVS